MNATNISIFMVGLAFIVTGNATRKAKPKTNWIIFWVGGITMIGISLLSMFRLIKN